MFQLLLKHHDFCQFKTKILRLKPTKHVIDT
jgi:hypothetical protein